MRVFRTLASLYRPGYVRTLAYMLQSTEYDIQKYLAWFWATSDFSQVMQRRELEPTRIARALVRGALAGVLAEVLVGLSIAFLGFRQVSGPWLACGIALILSYPIVIALLLPLPVWFAGKMIIGPRRRQQIIAAAKIFADHPGQKIAVLGSYGKTSVKELLATVLGASMKVAATPGNQNVPISHAAFAAKLLGDEDVLILELGEGAPGDIARLAELTHPTHAVVTGLAPAHLDQYKTLVAAAQDIFSINDFVDPANVYVNDEAPGIDAYILPGNGRYNRYAALGWKVEKPVVSIKGTSFTLRRGTARMRLESGLLGRHNIGPLAIVAVIAYEQGMSEHEIEAAIATTMPHEHRLSPYLLAGATIIDDTYNGNIEGIRAGAELLAELKATGKKWYVTPGLVDQGEETERVHKEMGKLIAAAHPDVVVLMRNSVTEYIQQGLTEAAFDAEVRVQDDPLGFYTHLDHFVASGDLMLMQNDWPDNYR